MDEKKPCIDAKFYLEEEIDDELKCPSCLNKFNSPRLLPCGDSICYGCIEYIKDESNDDDSYICPVCKECNIIKEKNLPLNKILDRLLKKQSNEIYRNKNVEKLKKNLTNLNSNTEKLENYLNYPQESIKEHCKGLMNQIDLVTEKNHQLINEFHDSLFNTVKEFENECLDYYASLNENDEFENDMKLIVKDINECKRFFAEEVNYLRRINIDDEQINKSISSSEYKISIIKEHLSSFKLYLFKNCENEFIENNIEIKSDLLGKLKLNKIGLKSINEKTLSFNYQYYQHQILAVHLTYDNKIISIRYNYNINNYNDNNSIILDRLNESGGLINTGSSILCNNNYYGYSITNITAKSIFNEEKDKILIFIRYSMSNQYNNFDHEILIFNTSLIEINKIKVSNIKNIVSIDEYDSKYYILLTSSSTNKNFLSVYDNNLNVLEQLGENASKETDPFYFSLDIVQLRVSEDSFIYLIKIFVENKMKMMDKNTGLIIREFCVNGSLFDIVRNELRLISDELHIKKIFFYDKLGRKQNEFNLSDEFAKCTLKFYSKFNAIGLNISTGIFTIANFVY